MSLDREEAAPVGDFAIRLRSVAPSGKGAQKIVGSRAGIPAQSMSKYWRGPTEPNLKAAASIARAVGVRLEWLAAGYGPANAAEAGFIGVAIYDVRLAAGAASFADAANAIGEMPFDKELLRQLGRADATDLGVMEAEGDSMEPLIADGARVVIDFRDTRLREGVFAFRVGDELRIKRLRRMVDGVEVLSENPRYKAEMLSKDHLDQFAIIGRALWAGSPL